MNELREKSNELEKRMTEFELVEKENNKWTEMEIFEAKQKTKAEELELKEKKLQEREKELELKQKELEERSTQAEMTLKRSMIKLSEADSHAHLTKRHRPLGEAREESWTIYAIGEGAPILDSEFNDFDKTMNSFVVGQIWAIYDDVDIMPRIYGLIKKVYKSQLRLKVTIFFPPKLERVPLACGRFRYGITQTLSYLLFSHEMHPIKLGRDFTDVYPRRGETWALFRDWTESLNNDWEHKGPFKYDFVEVKLHFVKDQGIGVAYLGKVEGFVSIFQHAAKDGVFSMMIPPDEMKRFAHKVPSFKMNGDEKEGVPPGSFELDPAAIASSILHLNTLEEKEEETERQIQDSDKAGDVKDQDEVIKEIPTVVLD